jgi:hypothetical protein
LRCLDNTVGLSQFAGPGGWNDPDLLEVCLSASRPRGRWFDFQNALRMGLTKVFDPFPKFSASQFSMDLSVS